MASYVLSRAWSRVGINYVHAYCLHIYHNEYVLYIYTYACTVGTRIYYTVCTCTACCLSTVALRLPDCVTYMLGQRERDSLAILQVVNIFHDQIWNTTSTSAVRLTCSHVNIWFYKISAIGSISDWLRGCYMIIYSIVGEDAASQITTIGTWCEGSRMHELWRWPAQRTL